MKVAPSQVVRVSPRSAIFRDPSKFGGDNATTPFNNCGDAPSPRPCGSADLPAQPCPMLVDIGTNQPLRLDKIEMGLEVHVSTMFGKAVMTFTNNTDKAVFPLLKFPTKESGSILYCWAKIGNAFFETNVMSAEQAGKAAKKGKAPPEMPRPTEGGEESRGGGGGGDDWQKYNPNCFNLPLGSQIAPGKDCTIIVSFFEPLDFTNGAYFVHVPFSFDQSMLNGDIAGIASVYINVNTAVTTSKLVYSSHPMEQASQPKQFGLEGNRFELATVGGALNTDILLSFSLDADDVIINMCYHNDDDKTGGFALFISPPNVPDSCTRRKAVFMLDQSGSMRNMFPFAVQAMHAGMSQLKEGDQFQIICFDDQHQICFKEGEMAYFDERNEDAAKAWLETIECRYTTNIIDPVKKAMAQLGPAEKGVSSQIYLITDGCVDNEVEIANTVAGSGDHIRVSTLGIGGYCNQVFLKNVANSGRGFFRFAINGEDVEYQMKALFETSSVCMLQNITVQYPPGAKKVKTSPDPCPDLYTGAPIMLCGLYEGMMAKIIINITATDAAGEPWSRQVKLVESTLIPYRKVFAKQQIDILMGQLWLDPSNTDIKKEIIALSVAEGIPCPHTQTICYASSSKEEPLFDESGTKEETGGRTAQKKKKEGMSTGTMILAGGAVFVVGACIGLACMGNSGATASNATDMFQPAALSGGGMQCGCCGLDLASHCSGCPGAPMGGDVCGSCTCVGDGCGKLCGTCQALPCFGTIAKGCESGGGMCMGCLGSISEQCACLEPICEGCISGSQAAGASAQASCGHTCLPMLSSCGSGVVDGCGNVGGMCTSLCGMGQDMGARAGSEAAPAAAGCMACCQSGGAAAAEGGQEQGGACLSCCASNGQEGLDAANEGVAAGAGEAMKCCGANVCNPENAKLVRECGIGLCHCLKGLAN